MAIGCGAKCAKFLLIIFNAIFWLSGACVLACGLWLLLDKDATKIFDLAITAQGDNTFKTACYILIGIGAFVFLVGFLGCCGAIRESKCLLGLYIFALVVVFVVELAAGILAAVYKDKITNKLHGELETAMQEKKYYGDDMQYTTWGLTVNFVQAKFKCCGFVKENGGDYEGFNSTYGVLFPYSCCNLKSGTDWERPKETDVTNWTKCQAREDTDFYPKYGIPFPYTCCKQKDGTETSEASEATTDKYVNNWELCEERDSSQFNSTPCFTSVEDWIKDHLIILIGVGIGIACLEIFGFIFAVLLCRNTGDAE